MERGREGERREGGRKAGSNEREEEVEERREEAGCFRRNRYCYSEEN